MKQRREHRVTHPILGPSTWTEMWAYADKQREAGNKICTWCHSQIGPGRRTRCGKNNCAEHIWQATSWTRCRQVCLRRCRTCQCGARAAEVDHVVPVSLGGLSDQNNLRGLCRPCHLAATAQLRKEKKTYVARTAPRIDIQGVLRL